MKFDMEDREIVLLDDNNTIIKFVSIRIIQILQNQLKIENNNLTLRDRS